MTDKFLFSPEGRDFLHREYVVGERSACDIAKELDTYPNKVNRALKKHGYERCGKSEAQKRALASGRAKHPTKGKERHEEEKLKISEGMAKAWKQMDEKTRQERTEFAKKQWQEMPEEQREKISKLASEGLRRASKVGSRLEHYLLSSIRVMGHEVIFHAEWMIHAEEMHVDLLLPQLKVAIEIDGPAHHWPVWGEEQLAKTVNADLKKTGLLISEGFVVLRLKHLTKNISEYHLREVFGRVKVVLENIITAFPPLEQRLIEVIA